MPSDLSNIPISRITLRGNSDDTFLIPLTTFRIIAQKTKRIRNGHQTRIKKRFTWIVLLVLTPAVLFAVLNFQPLYSTWTVSKETRQLERRAAFAPEDVENPAPLTEDFEEGLSAAFWDITIINGAGLVSNETTWHAAEMVIDHQLTLPHVQDPKLEAESPKW